ncbi:hypothetical protein [Phenylobacterium immobile]|uniref:hypothetical protein n=1 Tax=Phenylobacterium immobile TaxID=21 RepID=UPI00159EF32B|nr:hypothetical protein [Phenylobacterium immobile]
MSWVLASPIETLGVAAITLLQPMLSPELGHVRTRLVDLARLSASTVVDDELLVFLIDRSAARRKDEIRSLIAKAKQRAVLVRWQGVGLAALAGWTSDLDLEVATIADPWAPRSGWIGGVAVEPLPLLSSGREIDALIREFLPLLRRDEAPPYEGAPPIICLANSAEKFAELAPLLMRASARHRTPLIVVTRDVRMIREAGAPKRRIAAVFSEADPAWLDLLPTARVVVIAADDDDAAAGVWVRTAAYAGAPVVAGADSLNAWASGAIVEDDWERGLSLYLNDSPFRASDPVKAKARLMEQEEFTAVLDAWKRLLPAAQRAVPARRDVPRPRLMVFVDLAQDIDILLPVALAVRRDDRLELQIVVTDWLERVSPRTFELLNAAGLAYAVVPRKRALTATAPSFEGVDAFISASETNQPAHRAAYALTVAARRRGVATFTLQHGFENIGLTYRDAVHGDDVRFASDYVFTWGKAERLPNWVPPETLYRVVPAGSPKSATRQAVAAGPLPIEREWARKVGLFENLHWHRYDEADRGRFIERTVEAADRFTDTLFIVKPHGAGRWLNLNADRLPARNNLLLVDSLDPAWSAFAAPVLAPLLDLVVTTPSTVAVDAVRAGRPVAIFRCANWTTAYDPLPVLEGFDDWDRFIREGRMDAETVTRGELFLRGHSLPGDGAPRIARKIYAITSAQRRREAAA